MLYMEKFKLKLLMLAIFAIIWYAIWELVADRVEEWSLLANFMGYPMYLMVIAFVCSSYFSHKKGNIDDEMSVHVRGWAAEKAAYIVCFTMLFSGLGLIRSDGQLGAWASEVGWTILTMVLLLVVVWVILIVYRMRTLNKSDI